MLCAVLIPFLILTISGGLVLSGENAAPASETSKPLKVFVCSGQSNMVGMLTNPNLLPTELQSDQQNLIFDGEKWIPLGPNAKTSSNGKAEPGPELSFASEMSKSLGESVGIIKYAFPGRPIGHWKRKSFNPPFELQHESRDKETLIKHGLYYALLDRVLKAKKSRPIEIVGMLWMQGESDAHKPELAAAYAANLESLIADARRDFGAPEMAFVAGRVNPLEPPAGPYAGAPEVRKAQAECPAPKYAWIDCDGLSKGNDNLHYNTAGIVEMGKRFATAMSSFVGKSALLNNAEFFTPESDKAALAKANTAASEEGLPKVLLLGDSISIGYFPVVKESLKGVAGVTRPNENCGDTPRGLRFLDKWLGDTKWDVIHFNWGLWDLCYRNPESKNQGNRDKVNGKLSVSPEDYEKNLNALVDRLQKTGASLVWASTTIVPEEEAGRYVGDDVKYNAIAEKVMKARGVPINDLHALSATFSSEMFVKPGDVHFKKPGSQQLGKQVAEKIRSVLPASITPATDNQQ